MTPWRHCINQHRVFPLYYFRNKLLFCFSFVFARLEKFAKERKRERREKKRKETPPAINKDVYDDDDDNNK